MKITATVICFNEESNIGQCLSSLDFVDEIIVVDSFSTDNTVAIAKKYTNNIYSRSFTTYADQKNFAASLATNPFVLSIDADEKISETLKNYLISNFDSLIKKGFTAFSFPRKTFYLGKFINYCWYPDYKVRLYDKNICRWDNSIVHESLLCDGKVFYLPRGADIYHYSYKSIYEHIQKINKYTELIAQSKSGSSFVKLIFLLTLKPPLKFVKMYLIKLGFLDGLRGFVISVIGSLYEALKYIKAIAFKIGSQSQQ